MKDFKIGQIWRSRDGNEFVIKELRGSNYFYPVIAKIYKKTTDKAFYEDMYEIAISDLGDYAFLLDGSHNGEEKTTLDLVELVKDVPQKNEELAELKDIALYMSYFITDAIQNLIQGHDILCRDSLENVRAANDNLITILRDLEESGVPMAESVEELLSEKPVGPPNITIKEYEVMSPEDLVDSYEKGKDNE